MSTMKAEGSQSAWLTTTKPGCDDSQIENVRLDVHKEVQKVIGLWVENVEENQPTEQQDENLKAEIIRLAELVKTERIKRARLANDEDRDLDEDISANSKTIDNRRKVRVPDSPNASKPTTLLELTIYILGSFDDDKLRELKFNVYLGDNAPIPFKSRDQFQAALDDVQNDRIDVVELGRWKFWANIQRAYLDIQAMICTSNILRERINKLAGTFATLEEGVVKWNENFVEPTGKNDLGHVCFCCDYSKGSAIVVSGESGSGKTWISQKYIPDRLRKHDLTLIYCSLEENDGHERIKSDDSLKCHKMACDKGMRYLRDANHGDCDVYQCLRDLSVEYAKGTDYLAYAWFHTKIEKVLSKDDIIKEWWNAEGQPKFEILEKLVLVVDEVEKNPELARGLVSNVRRLYLDVKKHKAYRVLLVLAGSGLDRLFIDRPLPKGSYWTDPPRANIIKLRGPDLNQNEIYGIPTNCFLKGTYSRILATNTRMLTRGVLPIMMIPELTAHVSDEKKAEKYVALGSSNIVMDYAARKYMVFNGLGRMQPHSVAVILLQQFKLLLWERLMSIMDSNPAAVKMLDDLDVKMPSGLDEILMLDDPEVKMPSDLDEILALGLVTSDVKSTSLALRYLACNGNTAPINGQDGIVFEIPLQHHLVRLCEAYNSRRQNNDSSQDHGTYWVGRYDLRQAWPPSSSKRNAELTDIGVTSDEVEKGYKNHNDEDCHDDDIDTINSLLRTKNHDFDLVLRQTVTNVQGADVMILSRKAGKVVLHLFQCQDTKDIPGVNSKRLRQSFWSLGVKVTKDGTDFNVEPDHGSAGYSYLGTQQFAETLSQILGTPVSIGHRILVFSQEWKGELTRDFLQKAEEKGVMVWTREMLEPTISALYTPIEDASENW